MRRLLSGAIIALLGALTGCAGAAAGSPAVRPASPLVGAPPATKATLEGALAAMARHDRDDDWGEATCKATAALFAEASAPTAAARYDAGLVEQRCRHDEAARALFGAALAADPAFYPARAALALYAAGEGGAALERAIAAMNEAVTASRFTNVEALTVLGVLEMRRGNADADAEGASDLARAEKSFHRALAIDDGYLPALNQLALARLEAARRGGKGARRADAQALELAALTCAQAIRKSPRYAPIHNTAGLVAVELGDLSRAAAEFEEARRLDPAFFEAHMNAAAVNLAFRGFERAEQAYRAAVALHPADYDARLGLSLAIRGQIDAANEERNVAAAAQELTRAKSIAPERPEAYFNEAILTQAYLGRRGAVKDQLAAFATARSLLRTFLAKAGDRADLADAKRRAEERIQEMGELVEFIEKAPPAAASP